MVRIIQEGNLYQPTERPQPKSLILPDRRIIIYHGFPLSAGEFIYPPENPHVFNASELTAIDRRRTITLHNTWIMLGDGMTRRGKRIFANGQEMSKVVEAYQQNAGRLGLPRLDVLIACGGEMQSGIYVSNLAIPFYTVGGQVHISNHWAQGGGLILTVNTKGAFIGV